MDGRFGFLHLHAYRVGGWDECRDQPDAIIADPSTQLESVLDREPWRSLRAVKLHHVYSVNPDLIERPGPQYNDGLRWLIDRLTPLATKPA